MNARLKALREIEAGFSHSHRTHSFLFLSVFICSLYMLQVKNSESVTSTQVWTVMLVKLSCSKALDLGAVVLGVLLMVTKNLTIKMMVFSIIVFHCFVSEV